MRLPYLTHRVIAISWVVVGLLVLVVLGAMASLLRQQESEAISQSSQDKSNLVRAAEVSLNRVLIGVDVLLGGTSDLLQPALKANGQLDEALASALLRSVVAQNLMVRDIFIITSDGDPVIGTVAREQLTSRANDLPKGFLPDINAKFIPELVFSEPVAGWSSQEPTLFFGRTIQMSQGRKWVVIAEVTIPALSSVLPPISEANGTQIVIEDQHAHVLALMPRDDARLGTALARPLPKDQSDGNARVQPERTGNESSVLATRAVLYRNVFISASRPISSILDSLRERQKPIKMVVGAMVLLILASGAITHVFLLRLIRSRQHLEQVKLTLDQALGSINDGFLITDSHDRVVTWNERYLEYLPYLRSVMAEGVEAIRLIEAGARYIYPHGTQEEWDTWVKWRMGKRYEGIGQIEFVNKNGQALVFIDRRTPDGGVVCVLRDVTVLKNTERSLLQAKEQAEVANAAKTQFLATMSHEIRTPMNGVLGMAQLLAKSDVSETERIDYARVIIDSGEKLLELINDLLDISKIEAGKIQIENLVFKPSELLEDMVALFGVNAQNKGLSIQTAWQGQAHARFRGDAQKIRQMLANLVSNAIKFTDQGQVRMEASVREKDVGHVVMRFSVTDSGIGIASDETQALFKPFSQLGPGQSFKHGGTGLGLSIVKGYAQAMGGDVGVASEVGQGSQFWFEVVVEPVVMDPQGHASDTRPAGHSGFGPSSGGFKFTLPGARLKVLVVDDNPVNRQVVELMLRKLSTDVVIASDGVQAVESVKSERPDLVLMDCMMPVMDGFDATRAIRQWESAQHIDRTPVVALTARAYDADQQLCRDAGMDDFIAKPIEMGALERVVGRFRGQMTLSMGEESVAQQPPPLPDEHFDEAGLIERLDGDADIARRVVELYLKDLPNYVAGVRQSVQGMDTAEVVRQAHALVGASANVSATRMASLSRQMEHWAKQGALSDLTDSLPMLEQCAQTTEEKLRTFCQG